MRTIIGGGGRKQCEFGGKTWSVPYYLLRMNGLSDPTEPTIAGTHGVGGHSVGMGIDLGVRAYISREYQISSTNMGIPATTGALPLPSTSGGWSIQNAIGWSAVLPNGADNHQSDALLNFLSVYALTQNTSTTRVLENGNTVTATNPGTWALLPVKNGEAVRNALFGSGVQDAHGLIQNVWIGGTGSTNPYAGINAVLDQLGFSGQLNDPILHHAPFVGHQTHFHIDLRAPELQQIIVPPQNLLADGTASNQVAPSDTLVANAQTLLDEVKADLNLTQGEVTMFIPDMPNVPPQDVPVMIAQANQAQSGNVMSTRSIGICYPVPNGAQATPSVENMLSPIGVAREYFYLYEHQKMVTDPATSTILQQPKHGILRMLTEADRGTLFSNTTDPLDLANPVYVYIPEKGYVGKDSATIQVDFGGIKVNVKYYFQAVDLNSIGEGVDEYLCKKGPHWKISSTIDANGNSTFTSVEYQSSTIAAGATTTDTAALAATLSASILSTLSVNPSLVTFNLADLAGGAVGQAVGNTITLDTNAAGHNWYIDTTPWDNSEYLPTSNPYEWVAKEGTDAYGKMDMLSVLLHEYGHALGIDHSADNHDYMATTLTPGVRRMPSAEEMALMQSLVGQLKGEMVADGSTPTATPPYPPYQGGGQDGPNLRINGVRLD